MVPKGWEAIKLNDICDKVTSGSRNWAQYYSEEGSKFIRMTNLQRNSIYLDLSDLKFVDIQDDSSDGKRTSLEAGDILMSITAELGKIGWVHEGLGESFINQHTALIRLKENKSYSKYIAYLLSSREMNHRINRLNDSGAKAGLNLTTIRSIPLAIPPIQEQQKIAEMLTTWDKAITTTERLIDNSTQQKKALMQQLLTGKKRLLDESGKRFEGEWEKYPVGDICQSIVPGRNKPKEFDGNIPWVTTPEFQGRYIPSKLQKNYISQSVIDECGAKLVPEGAVVIAAVGDLGLTAIASEIVVLNQQLHAFVCGENVHNEYLFYWLSYQKPYMESIASKTTIQYMNKKNCESIPVKLPTLEEQQKIATVLTNADKEIELLDQQLADLQQEKKALMQVLLTGKKRVVVDGALV